ncbi:MAG: hypothetical protein GYB53_18620 [Rhodobacteraceae bacterium]|uniref:hypothetical protein n=1 Tax=Oceanicola sp. S124 TaxID=1042378 RepID=UPI0002558998|nr:hypothetical protein [Oceanicola sp. S124]MBR9765474.1 hypothetical protein [Paracoccaceae bacterium]MBR9819687.1 hypothetical protein [Paracoccaceae bacterium]
MTDISQDIFDRSESIAEALWVARNLHGALLHMMDSAQAERREDLDGPMRAVLEASRDYCGRASDLAGEIARSAKDIPE